MRYLITLFLLSMPAWAQPVLSKCTGYQCQDGHFVIIKTNYVMGSGESMQAFEERHQLQVQANTLGPHPPTPEFDPPPPSAPCLPSSEAGWQQDPWASTVEIQEIDGRARFEQARVLDGSAPAFYCTRFFCNRYHPQNGGCVGGGVGITVATGCWPWESASECSSRNWYEMMDLISEEGHGDTQVYEPCFGTAEEMPDPDIDPSYVRCSTVNCIDHGGHTFSVVTQCNRGLTRAQCDELHNLRVQSAIVGHTVSVDPCEGPGGNLGSMPVDLATMGLDPDPPGPSPTFFICSTWRCAAGDGGMVITPCSQYEDFEDCAERHSDQVVDEAMDHWEEEGEGHEPVSFKSCQK